MNFIEKVRRDFGSRENPNEYIEPILSRKIFGWSWVLKNCKLSEEFLEEFAESLDWGLVFMHQDFSSEFAEKFNFKFKSACPCIHSKSSELDKKTELIRHIKAHWPKSYYLKAVFSSEKTEENFIKAEIILTGPKGIALKQLLGEVFTINLYDNQTVGLTVLIDFSIKKNSVVAKLHTTKRIHESCFFIN